MDDPATQASYFQEHVLSTLTEALAADMTSVTINPSDRDPNLPFKIYVALLDKWEIGYPLSERLALRALHTLETGVEMLLGSTDVVVRAQGDDVSRCYHNSASLTRIDSHDPLFTLLSVESYRASALRSD
jgi:hypothetical protein